MSFDKAGDVLDNLNLEAVDYDSREELIEKLRNMEPPGCRYNSECWGGYIRRWDEEKEMWTVVRECECRRLERAEASFKDKVSTLYPDGLVPDYWSKNGTFETFKAERDDAQVGEALNMCRRYTENFIDKVEPGGHWLYLEGEVGLGKTHLVWAVWHELREKSIPALVISAPEFLDKLRPGNENQELRMSFAKQVKFLAIDDFLRHRIDSDHVFDVFSDLVDYRYEWELPTVITSNIGLSEEFNKETGRRWDPIQDRIAGRSTLVSVQGESYRTKGGGLGD